MSHFPFWLICNFLLISVSIPAAFAGDKFVQGYFFSNEGDSVQGQLVIPVQFIHSEPNMKLIQWRILFINSRKKEQYLLEPHTVGGFGFKYKGEEYHFHSMPNHYGWRNPFNEINEKVFMELVVEGEVNLYKILRRQEVGGLFLEDGAEVGANSTSGGSYVDMYFLEYMGELTRLKPTGYHDQIESFFQHSPLFLAQIANQRITKKELADIISRYNEWFKSEETYRN